MKENPVNPLVSIIMNCLDGEQFLNRAIDSIFKQTFENWEIIFLDNGSKDNSRSIAESYGERIKIFSLPVTVELGEARNKALSYSNGELIAFLDVDDAWLEDKLEKQVNLFNNPNIGMVYCDTIVLEGNRSINLFDIMKPASGQISCELLKSNFITTSSLTYRKKTLDKLSFVFRNNFLLLVDYDLSIRVAQGTFAAFVDEPLAIVYKHKNNASQTQKDRYFRESKVFLDYLNNDLNLNERCSKGIQSFLHRHNIYIAELEFESGNIRNAKKIIRKSANRSIQNLIMFFLLYIFPSYNFYRFIKNISRKFLGFIKKL